MSREPDKETSQSGSSERELSSRAFGAGSLASTPSRLVMRSFRAAGLLSALAATTALDSAPNGKRINHGDAVVQVRSGHQTLRTRERIALHDCKVRNVDETLRCGTYFALENRQKSTGRRLPLRVIVIGKKSPAASAPIFVFAGGPGQAATEYAEFLVKSRLREQSDVVLVDQRGTAEGHRLDCPLPVSKDDAQPYLSSPYEQTSFWATCARTLAQRADLTQYATAVAATDVDEVRRALGYPKINIIGGSYGSRVAIIYAKLFGSHVQAAVLTAAAPLEIKLPLHHPDRAQAAFDLMVADCQADSKCSSAYPHIAEDLDSVLRSLATAPATVWVKHPVSGARVEMSLTRDAFADQIRNMLYSANDAREIPWLLTRARAGDFKQVAQDAVQSGYEWWTGLNIAMGLSANCNEDTERITTAEIQRYTEGTFIGPVPVSGKLATCRVWPDAVLPRHYFSSFRSRVPAVIISGKYDNVSSAAWGEVTRRHFPNSRHIVMAIAHSPGRAGRECMDIIASQLFRTGRVDRIGASCVGGITIGPFRYASDVKQP